MARKRRSFPINLKENYKDRAVQEQVLIDLVHKHPRGPQGLLTKEDYDTWDTDPNTRHSDGTICGYDPVDLYRMISHVEEVSSRRCTNEWDFRELVWSLFPGCGDRGVTRRSRRYANRIGRAVSKVMRQGLPGIWNVQWGYGDTNAATMHANSEGDAINQAKIFFGPLIGENNYRLSASFVREGSALELLNANQDLIAAFDRQVAAQEKRIAEIKEQIQVYEAGKQFVELYALNCMQANLEG